MKWVEFDPKMKFSLKKTLIYTFFYKNKLCKNNEEKEIRQIKNIFRPRISKAKSQNNDDLYLF